MAEATFKCKECGTETTHVYDDCGSYSSLFNTGEKYTVVCKNRECKADLGIVYEY